MGYPDLQSQKRIRLRRFRFLGTVRPTDDEVTTMLRDSVRLSRVTVLSGCIGLVLGLLLLPAQAAALGLELEARYWAPDLSGSAELEDFPDIGLDVGELLGMSADAVPEARLTFRPFLGIFARGTYSKFANSGETGFDLGDFPIDLDARITSNLDFDYFRLGLGWQFVTPKKTLRIGPYVEAKGLTGDASIAVDSSFGDLSESESFDAVFGSVGGLLEIQPSDKFQIFADASVLVGSDEADFLDAELGARFYPIYMLGIGLGYRVIEVDGIIDNIKMDLDFKGFFGSVVLRF